MSILPNTAESCRHIRAQTMLILELTHVLKKAAKYPLLYPVPYFLLFPKPAVFRAEVW